MALVRRACGGDQLRSDAHHPAIDPQPSAIACGAEIQKRCTSGFASATFFLYRDRGGASNKDCVCADIFGVANNMLSPGACRPQAGGFRGEVGLYRLVT